MQIEAKNISRIYESASQDTPALKGISLAIAQGESVAIVGKSGSGKSTLMHILATLDKPSSGELLIDGTATHALKSAELDNLRNKRFGFVFQQFFIQARSTCLENAVLPLVIMGLGKKERNKRGLEILKAVGLEDQKNQKAGELSGGQKQRLCIARAIIANPQIIFADEPTGNLDSENGKNIINLLFQLQREKYITLIIVTHDTDIARLCNRVITIKDGQII
ncbi:MAG: ABC transporter ATP-binding protein [bacterium]|nr:ABC transporter ATP-binding protein [bacterium]